MDNSDRGTESKIPDFSLAFQQMASVVAIAKTGDLAEILAELVKQCFAILAGEPLKTSEDVIIAVHTLYGIHIAPQDAKMTIENLLTKGELVQLPGGHLGLRQGLHELLERRIEASRDLQDVVRESWLSQVSVTYPELDPACLWRVLGGYLTQSFRRHGIQAITLLDPTAEIAQQQTGSLSAMLNAEISKEFDGTQIAQAREAVALFFSTIGSDRKRAEYITQLADAAFNYFSLTVAPDIAERLRTKLNPMTLFLDTNFLFGILNLHHNSQVEVSQELLEAIKKYSFPFTLRYHQATKREMNSVLEYFGNELRKYTWPPALSRAAVSSRRFNGIELRYHTVNSQQKVSPDDFLSPHRHWDVLLKDKGIDVYNPTRSQSRLRERADLEAEYRAFLETYARDKSPDVIQHDMDVLQAVRGLQNRAKSSLDAGALLVTCDNLLFRFDLERSRRERTSCYTVLPSLFWQLLRPFVPNGEDFDRAFAETFALPEFSLVRGGAAKAASRMLGILASYGGLPEETAVKMLANDMLLDELQTKTGDAEWSEVINAELARTNEELIEEVAAAKARSEREKEQREATEQELIRTQNSLSKQQQELIERKRVSEEQQQTLVGTNRVLSELEEANRVREQQALEAAMRLLGEQKEKEAAEAQYQAALRQKEAAESQALHSRKVAGVSIAILGAVLFELSVHFVWPWQWLLSHEDSYGLQGCIIVVIATGILGFWVKPWRKILLVTVLFGALLVGLPLLGGPSSAP